MNINVLTLFFATPPSLFRKKAIKNISIITLKSIFHSILCDRLEILNKNDSIESRHMLRIYTKSEMTDMNL